MTKRLDRPVLRPGDESYQTGIVPKDAATLVIVRFDDDAPRVLMGRRNAQMRFMPGKLVFPGGRVDRTDRNAPAEGELDPAQLEGLLYQMRGRSSPVRARSLILAAIRETYEETGVLVGTRADTKTVSAESGIAATTWKAFLDLGVIPKIDAVHFLARAITPPGMVKRFDTRFFMANADSIALQSDIPNPGELVEPDWMTFAEARNSDPAPITDIMLDIAEAKLDGLAAGRVPGPLSFFSVRNGKARMDQIPLQPG